MLKAIYNILLDKVRRCLGYTSVTKNSKRYEINYYLNNKQYKICFGNKRIIRDIVKVESISTNTDVTDDILEKLGPCYNFYNIPTTPLILGYDNLKVTYKNGKSHFYDANEIINPCTYFF